MAIQNPRLPELTLDLQKTTVFVARPFRLTQTDQGYIQPFRLTNAWSQYDVSAENLNFAATKPDGNIIDIKNEPNRFKKEGAVWLFTLPEEIAQAVGNVTAYFYITDKSNNILATTTKFGYEIGARYGDDVKSNSYISEIEDMEKRFQDYLTNAHNQLNEQNKLTNDSRKQLNDFLTQKQTEVTNWISSKTAEIDRDIKSRQDQLNSLNSQYTAKYNELVATWNNRLTAINSEWSAKKTDYDNKAKAQRDSVNSEWNTLKSQFTTDRNNAIKTANDQFSAKLNSIQNDWNSEKSRLESEINQYKSALEAKVQPVADKVNDLLNTKLPDLNGKADAVQKKIDQLRADFNSIDFSSYATKSETSVAILKPFPVNVTDMDNLLEGRWNVNTLTDAQFNALQNKPASNKNATVLVYKNGNLGWQIWLPTDNRAIFHYRGNNGSGYTSWQRIAQNTTSYSNQDIDQKIAANVPSGTIVTRFDISSRTPTKEVGRYNQRWLVENGAIDDLAAAINNLRGTGAHKITNAVDVNTLTGDATMVSAYICQNINNTNTPPFFNDNRGTLIVANYDGNAKSQIWIPVGTPAQSGAGIAYRYIEGSNVYSWKKLNSDDITSALNTANAALPKSGGTMNLHSTINWTGSNSTTARDGNLGGLVWTGATDNAAIFANNTSDDNLDLVFNLGDDGSNHISFRWNNAEKAAIDVNGKYTGTVDWTHINGRPDTTSLQNQINEIKNTIPDIHTVSTEAEGTTYLASHPNAIIFVKG